MATEVRDDPYDAWRDRAIDEVTISLERIRNMGRTEFASHATSIIKDVTGELVELALRAEALRPR